MYVISLEYVFLMYSNNDYGLSKRANTRYSLVESPSCFDLDYNIINLCCTELKPLCQNKGANTKEIIFCSVGAIPL